MRPETPGNLFWGNRVTQNVSRSAFESGDNRFREAWLINTKAFLACKCFSSLKWRVLLSFAGTNSIEVFLALSKKFVFISTLKQGWCSLQLRYWSDNQCPPLALSPSGVGSLLLAGAADFVKCDRTLLSNSGANDAFLRISWSALSLMSSCFLALRCRSPVDLREKEGPLNQRQESSPNYK